MTLPRMRNPRQLRRVLLVALAWFAGGVIVSMFVAWGIVIANPQVDSISTLQSVGEKDAVLTANISSGFGSVHVDLASEFGPAWSPMRAAGPPDVPAVGDNPAAWASLTQDGQREWLELMYDRAIVPKEVQIYENLSPGAVSRVMVHNDHDDWQIAWSGKDPAAPNSSGIYVAKIPLLASMAANRVRIEIDSPRVAGWNEIDAVGLVGKDGSLQWASDVSASSTYATVGRAGPIYPRAAFLDALPAWSDPSDFVKSNATATQQRTVEARGWPLLALYGPAASIPQTISNITISRPLSVTLGVPMRIWPFHPIWTGLITDGIFYGGALALLYVSTFGLRRTLRESSRLRHGCCIRCGYNLRYDFVAGCPECGWNRLAERVRAGDLRDVEMPANRF